MITKKKKEPDNENKEYRELMNNLLNLPNTG